MIWITNYTNIKQFVSKKRIFLKLFVSKIKILPFYSPKKVGSMTIFAKCQLISN
jgi:hypothetical protein